MDIDLDRARREAKARLAAARRGEIVLRADRAPRLADAQRAVARDLGERSWPALVARAEAELVLAGRRAPATVSDRALALARTLGEPRLRAATSGEAALALLELGVRPDAPDGEGATALHHAARAGRLEVVGALAGWVRVNRSARDAAGRTPLDVATDPAVRAVLAFVTSPRALGRARHGEAAWNADAGLLRMLASSPLADVRRVGDGVAIRTGLDDNSRNGVVCSRATPAQITAAIAWLGEVPAVWMIEAGSPLGPDLVRAGCRPERTAVHMAARTDALGVGLEPRAITDAAGLAAAYGRDAPREVALLASLGFDGPLRHFAIDGGFATTFTAGGVCALVDLWVAPAARRRGVGSALALGAVAASGAGLAVLAPTPATVPFYERLGFTLEASPPDRVYYTG